MSHLNELKNAVDDGRTAKLRQWRSILHWLVKKEMGYYAKQAEGYTNEDGVLIVRAETAFYSTWEKLVDSLGYDGTPRGWKITDDPLEDYLPPERKTAP